MARKYHQGLFTPLNPEKYAGDVKNIVYRSKWELGAFRWCDNNPEVVSYSSEEVVIPYRYDADNRIHRYFIDLKIIFKNGTTLLVEIKPFKDTQKPAKGNKKRDKFLQESLTYVKNQNKWEFAHKFAEANGWKFVIWTENELTKLGIPVKSSSPLKKRFS